MSRGLSLLIIATALAAATGCQWANRFGASRDPFGPRAACALPPESTKEEIVAYLNKNILSEEGQPGLRGWKTESAKIRMHGFSASASLQVEAPRNFRLRVSQPLSNTAMLDIGSNPEQFWVWSKDSKERVVLTCRHDEIPATAAHLDLPLPVQPEWLMEILGVVPLDPNEFRMERETRGSPFVKLISDCHGPTGEPMQRIIQVNACHGLVHLHELRNAEGKVIASASFFDHYHDPETKLILVKQIRLELPQDKMLLTLLLDRIEVNPPVTDGSVVFTVPQLPGHQTIDLAEVARSHRGAGAPERYADASSDFASPAGASLAPGLNSTPLEAPAWPPETDSSQGRAPNLGFEPDSREMESDSPPFMPPGGQFELPDSGANSPIQDPEKAFRGQSPEDRSRETAAPGIWQRLKSAFNAGGTPGAARPAAYSPKASRSSWGRPRLGLE